VDDIDLNISDDDSSSKKAPGDGDLGGGESSKQSGHKSEDDERTLHKPSYAYIVSAIIHDFSIYKEIHGKYLF
jgi:hypothetical protein